MNDNLKAILLTLFASVCGVTMNVFMKIALEDINVFSAGFLGFLW